MTTIPQLPTNAPTATIHPEVELLLCCARTEINTTTAERIKTLLRQGIDWVYLSQTAAQHGVMPLLYCSLNNTCPEAVPKPIWSQIRDYFYSNTRHNLFQTSELCKLLVLFQDHHIRAIPFKGAVLAASAYGNLGLREFGDLDILIPEQDVPLATELLISQGYQPPSQLSEAQEKPYFQYEQFLESAQYQGSYDFVRNDGKVFVELHWSLTKKDFPFPVEFNHLWEHINPIVIAETTVPNFSPEDALLFLCVHGSKHCWERLQWVSDVAELLRTYQHINWEQVLEQSRLLGCERMLCLGLLLAHTLLETSLPEEIVLKIQSDPVTRSLFTQVRQQLFDSSLGAFEEHLFRLKARERLVDKVRYLLGTTITPTEKEWAFLPLPKSLSFLYYLLRPLRLLVMLGVNRATK
ncbi:nucleotidyltransferase family protein [Allocoleopsis sp.]|uniref:nucleotidyltransferase domain-containing protein n=1 Tax=Allocoleopsis sp. TaxID=3088169 RepID=UPI002FD042C2